MGINPRIVLLPEKLLNCNEELPIIKLKHPRTGTPMLCIVGQSNMLFEIVTFTQKFSSWFIGDKVVEDGGFHMVTPLDPTFFILMYLNKDGKYCPLEDSLVDYDYPDTKHLLSCFTPDDLDHIANCKSVGNIQVYAYDKNKTLSWLQKKVEQILCTLKVKNIEINDGSKAVVYNPVTRDGDNDTTNCHQACRLVSEYLSPELSEELFKCFGLDFIENGVVCEDSEENVHKEKKTKGSQVSPVESYSKVNSSVEENKNKSKLTVAQKRLMKADKTGMKSISSFFQKK